MQEKKKQVSFIHFGNTGDVIASLPAIREFYVKSGVKPDIFLKSGHKAEYYEGATHPVLDEKGETVSLNDYMIEMLIPLLEAQHYIKSVSKFDGQHIDLNLSLIRNNFVNMPFGDIRRWYFYIFHDLACNLSEQYISVKDTWWDFAKQKLIVCRTERYINFHISYKFLRDYEDELVFAGTDYELEKFNKENGLSLKKLEVKSFFELAQALKQSKGLLSNQTMIFQIAEGLKIPRIVELCHFAPNVIPVGENAFDFYSQTAVEYYVDLLLTKKPSI